jgi:hypothetical protein
MVLTFFDKKGKKFRQIEGTGDEKALLSSKKGDTHKISTSQEQDMNNTPAKSIVIDEQYFIDVETSSGNIKLPKIGDDGFLIKVTDYSEDEFIEFKHINTDD